MNPNTKGKEADGKQHSLINSAITCRGHAKYFTLGQKKTFQAINKLDKSVERRNQTHTL